MSPQKASLEVRSPSRASLQPTSPSVRRVTSSSAISVSPSLREEDEAAIADSSDEEDLPLGVLLSQKRAREAERTRIAKLEAEVQELRNREKSRNLQLKREQERQRAKEAERLQEEQKKALRDARERRKVTAHTSVLHSPNYGAGDASMTTSPSARLSPSALSTSATAANINQMSTPKQAGRSSTVLPSPSMSSIGAQHRSSMMPPAHLADPRRGSIQRTEQPHPAMSGIQPHQAYLMPSPFTPEQIHHRTSFLPPSASGGYFVPHQQVQQNFSTAHSPSYHSGMPLPLGAPFASPPAQQAQPRRSSSRMAAPQPHHRSPLSPESTPRRQHSAWI
ncbi:hypothetical protein CBOM_02115 [Ceraceosorus bombacis]|uniref:Uncharacterized protein n=1 Tax=Ceraceosorus bombacis TaxID=401625 RepID=A0A0N7L9N1_9BASI|nr:hypothetical protein CBOM_02115 [Ceraceosorus bombacis]